MKYNAYWMHQNGDVIPVETFHISEIIKTPERFNYTKLQLEKIFLSHKEPMGYEGYARQQIMEDLIKNHGWIRIRYRPKQDTWIVELHSLTDDKKREIIGFLKQPNFTATRPCSDIRINELFSVNGLNHHI